ncbi:MAG: hypothetical protein WD716_03630 [Fimbriimonadaceae bacterium]
MRDYIAWYLIELRRRLRNVEPQQKVEDFLLETRTHLQESIEEMGARGILEDAATKSAIADFGHPSLVAHAFRGRRSLPSWSYWSTVLLVVLLLSPMAYQVVFSLGDVHLGAGRIAYFEFGWYIIGGLAAILVMTLLWRRWSALPITVGLAGVALVSGLVISGKVEPYKSPLSETILLMDDASAKKQAANRARWLEAYERSIVPMKRAIETHGSNPTSEFGKAIIGENEMPLFPAIGYSGHQRASSILPAEYEREGMGDWIPFDRSSATFILRSTFDKEEATKAWIRNGEQFFAYAESVRNDVAVEREALSKPVEVARGQVLQRLVGGPLLLIGFCGLVGVLVNAMVIGGSEGWSALLRREWRRQLN